MKRRDFLLGAVGITSILPLIGRATPTQITASLDLSRLLDCIAQVESGRNDQAIGRRANGTIYARGRYQLSEAAWFQHTNRPWKLAHNYFVATEVARRHLVWLNYQLLNSFERPYWLAYAWLKGFHGLRTFSHPGNPFDYAQRVTNLYNDTSTQ